MNTSKATTILLGVILSAGMAIAQAPASSPADTANTAQPAGRGHHQADPDKMAKHLAKKLNLSKDQEQQIAPILADRQQQMQSLRADTSMSKEDRRAKFQQLQQDSKSKIEAVLNDTQKQQFEQMMAERRNHRRHGDKDAAQPNTQPGL